MKKVFLLFLASVLSLAAMAQDTYKIDAAHSFVNFNIRHMGISFVNGNFKKFESTFQAQKSDFTDAKINFTVDANSINTNNDMRDNHLRTDDFFNVEKFPTMKFQSVQMKKLDELVYELSGNLTIRDVTKPVVFKVSYGGAAQDQKGNKKVGFSARTTINRFDFNVKYDPTGAALAKDVEIVLNLEYTLVK